MKTLFDGYVSNGKLALINPNRFKSHLYTLNGDVQIAIGEKEGDLEAPLRKYYWAALIKTVYRITGQNPYAIHERWKDTFLVPQDIQEKAGEIIILNSLTKLSRTDFLFYKNEIISFYANWGIELPEPNEVIV